MKLEPFEQETIINFNREEKVAYIFTYEKTWQKYLEGKLGLKPVMDNGHGGKEYIVDKKRIKPPRAPKKLSAETKAKMAKRLGEARSARIKKPKTLVATNKSDNRKQK